MTPESTEQLQRKRLSAAWARTYGSGRAAARQHDLDDEPRPVSDARAAWRRWHDAGLDSSWTAAEWPWFEALERARVEQLASDHLPGMASNLADTEKTAPPPGLAGGLYRSARRIFAGADSLSGPVLGSASTLGLYQRLKNRLNRRRLPLSDSEIVTTLGNARQYLQQPEEFADCIRPLIRLLAELEVPDTGNAGKPPPPVPAMPLNIDEEAPGETEDENASTERPGNTADEPDIQRAYPDYRIYSTAWDEEGPATQWLRPKDGELLKALLNPDRRQIRQLAHKLQRRLQAARLRQWQFDQEEGLLDPRRLSRLISDRANRRVFRREEESPIPSACVCFLVDLSGSMRGERQRIAAMTVDLAVHTLELCGIQCEVLGYTTAFGADNPVVSHWRRNGSPENPGRLNAIRHIVFKTANQPWRRARPGLGLMLREDFGRENIDGEALHWAARRLAARPESNRILMVLSDGQPYDEATANGNGRNLLENHLRSVIREIERSRVRLSAVGTGMTVSRFYHQAVTIGDQRDLGECLFNCLNKLLVGSQHLARHP